MTMTVISHAFILTIDLDLTLRLRSAVLASGTLEYLNGAHDGKQGEDGQCEVIAVGIGGGLDVVGIDHVTLHLN